ncbi:cytochrome ubiquinol oxidase subunit I [Desulfobulbus sp. TB]|nr:cytochrome ubiquinol oxidase subunit I [Desulfobulbus sp. TB]
MDRIDFPLLGNSIIMAVVILTHVFFAFFAVGGSVLAVLAEWWGTRKKDDDFIRLAKGVSGFLSGMMKINGVLGVAIVVLTIGLWTPFGAFLYSTQFWPFLAEGAVFLFLMIFAVTYHNTWNSVSRGMHIFYGLCTALFATAAGILLNSIWIFMMVPGKWIDTQSRWDAFNTPVFLESTIHLVLPCFINGALIIFVWSYWKSRKPSEDQQYYEKVNRFTGALGGVLLFLQPLSGISFLLKVKSTTEALPKPNPWAQLMDGAATPFLYIMIGLGSFAVICTILYWVLGHAKGRKALLAASIAMFIAFFIGGFTRERARKPYLIWGTMRMDQQFTRSFKEKANPPMMIGQSGNDSKAQVGSIDGGQVFKESQCQACHMHNGQGGSNGPDLSNVSERYNKKTIMNFILQPPEPANMVMPPFNGTDAELDALADYLLQNK